MSLFFKVRANRAYWGFLLAVQCVHLQEMTAEAVDGLCEAADVLLNEVDMDDVLSNEWERMLEMSAEFERRVADRRAEIDKEDEVTTYL